MQGSKADSNEAIRSIIIYSIQGVISMSKKSTPLKYIAFAVIAVLLLIEGVCLYQHHRTATPKDTGRQNVSSQPASATTGPQEVSETPDPDSPEGKVYFSFEKLLSQSSFRAKTDASINLRGKLIKGKRHMSANALVTGANDRDHLTLDMTTKTTTRGKTEKSHSTYKDGWYITNNGKEKTRTERSPEEVLSMVTFVSDIMQDASSQLEDMKVTPKGSDTLYEFTLSGETASYYFCQIIEQASMSTEELKNVTGTVDSLKMTCCINKKGVLKEQSASVSGKVSKSIFTIPVTLTETTSFSLYK